MATFRSPVPKADITEILTIRPILVSTRGPLDNKTWIICFPLALCGRACTGKDRVQQLKKGGVLWERVAFWYEMIKGLRLDFSLSLMDAMFDVLVSGYYSWLRRKLSRRAQEEPRLAARVKTAHERTRKTYGA